MTDTDLSPCDQRELAIATATATLVRGLVHEQISAIEDAAAKQAEDDDSDKPPLAKVSIAVEWPAGAESPAVTVSVAYSLRRKSTGTLKADGQQLKLEIGGAL